MASLASLANLGSTKLISFGNLDGSVCLGRSISFQRNASSFRRSWCGKRWRYVGVCRYSVTTDYIADQGTSVSPSSTYGGSKENETDTFLKAAPKPVLKSGPKVNPPPGLPSNGSKLRRDSDNEKISDTVDGRSNVVESLGDVLERAEKLETNKKVNVPVSKPPASGRVEQKNGKPISSMENSNRAKNTKSVWRKGNPVAAVEKIAKEPLRQESSKDEGTATGSQPVSPLRPPQPPQKIQPKLQARPSVAPPAPYVKKPVILKDVNATSKPPVTDGTDSAPKSKERKTILIDKFASKKPGVDPLIQAVLAPPKPGKSPPPGRFKDEFRKRSGPSGGARRRRVADDDEDTSDLIPGAPTSRKGRKWSKASRKAARLQAARDAAPVKMEIMEVDEEGMLIDELAYNLAISEGEILGYFYSKGIKPDGVQKLSRDMVKMVCNEYEVEVIDAEPERLEEMAKKKEIFDEDDLDKLEDRPPVLTIMGHVDHGKVRNLTQFILCFN